MLLTEGAKRQLVAFAVITVVAMTATAVKYARLPDALGFGHINIAADFGEVRGLYENAIVTHRGVEVGKVTRLKLRPGGVTVEMRVDDDSQIPRDVRAEMHSTSAVGEQYIDLVSRSSAGPYLGQGSVIPRSATAEMPQSTALLNSVDDLITSIPNGALGRVLDDLETAVGGKGADLQRLLDASLLLLNEASANIGPTRKLLGDLGPVLDTQQHIEGNVRSFTKDLASFTDQLQLSDRDIRLMLEIGPDFAKEVSGAVEDLSPTLSILLANLSSTGEVVKTYLPGVEQVLILYPAIVSALQGSLTTIPGAVQMGFTLNVNEPGICTSGYLPITERREPEDLSSADTPPGLYCKVPASGPTAVRGARNAPCLNNPGVRAATPQECLGLPSPSNLSSSRAAKDAAIAIPYVPATGRFLGPDGRFYLLGGEDGPGESWQGLFLGPLGK